MNDRFREAQSARWTSRDDGKAVMAFVDVLFLQPISTDRPKALMLISKIKVRQYQIYRRAWVEIIQTKMV